MVLTNKVLLIFTAILLLFCNEIFAQERYCWVSGDNFHDIKVAVSNDCQEGDLLWVVTNNIELDEWSLEQTIGQYCEFDSEIIIRKRNNGGLYLQCILHDEKSRKRRTDD
ncbi:MAG: hypothetical protein CM1200mP17_15860 [Woeseia sp.]|nr:MAG: hypothetical protein CM1200mP17_15860 [Woeseia sp.]